VVVKGTTNGASQTTTGEFQINAPRNGTLEVFFLLDIQQKKSPLMDRVHKYHAYRKSCDLDQVVVIGYGTVRKKDVTGSTVSVKGETLNEVKAPNIFNQLQGRAPGCRHRQ
jgi:hypothetical protein